jgi:cardiolipin synthase
VDEQTPHTEDEGGLQRTVKDAIAFEAHRAQTEGTTLAPVGTPDNPSNQILTLANVITFCRLILTGVFLWLFVTGGNRYLAVALYAIAATTDFLDGMVTRSTNTVSWLGKIMDPIMDRFLLFTGVLGLVARGDVPTWIAWFVLGRDAVLLVGSIALQHFRRRPVDVAFIGKVTTALLMVGFCFCLLDQPQIDGLGLVSASWLPVLNQQGGALGLLFVYAGIICSTYTAILYYLQGIHIAIQSKRAAR